MEPSYRYIIQKLQENPLVVSIEFNYHIIEIKWRYGIREKWLLPRQRLPNLSYPHRYKLFRLPDKMWPEDLSNGMEIKPIYVNGIDQIIDNVDKKGLHAKFLWSDYQKLGFYEQLVFPHEYIEFIKNNTDFNNIDYSDSVLNRSLQLIVDDQLTRFRYKTGYRISTLYRLNDKPGLHFIENFINFNDFGMLLSQINRNKTAKLLYKYIHRIIYRNNKKTRFGRTPTLNFDINSIRKVYDSSAKHREPRNINFYRLVFQDLNYENIDFIDFEPRFGEKALASYFSNNRYNYLETAPFDYAADDIAKYLNTNFTKFSDDTVYDLTFIDNDFKYDHDYIKYLLDKYNRNVRNWLIFVDLDHRNKFINLIKDYKNLSFGRAGKYINICRFRNLNGFIMHIKQI